MYIVLHIVYCRNTFKYRDGVHDTIWWCLSHHTPLILNRTLLACACRRYGNLGGVDMVTLRSKESGGISGDICYKIWPYLFVYLFVVFLSTFFLKWDPRSRAEFSTTMKINTRKSRKCRVLTGLSSETWIWSETSKKKKKLYIIGRESDINMMVGICKGWTTQG